MSRGTVEPAFIEGQRGKLFVMLRRPDGLDRPPCVLIVPPFAEEMNKTRPMVATVAQRLAARGVAAVMPDLFGTGDSAGEFREGDWRVWIDDLERTVVWARAQGCDVSRLLAVRLGCVLAAEWAGSAPRRLERSVFWQPVLDGARFMTQFLRLRVAASMMEDVKETVGGLRERLGRGESLEVAGYELSPSLVLQIEAARLSGSLTDHLGLLHWMEVVRNAQDGLPPPSLRAADAARALLASVETHVVEGEPYWAATEIVRNPELSELTVQVLSAAT